MHASLMRKFIFTFILVLSAFAYADVQTEPLRLAIVHSYSNQFQWTRTVEKGFLTRLKKALAVDVVYEGALNAKADPAGVPRIKEQILRDLKKTRFDLLFITDDDAFNHIARSYFSTQVKVIFAGVSNPMLEYGKTADDMNNSAPANLSGVLERIEFQPLIRLITDFLPGTKSLSLLFDRSPTADGVFTDFEQQIGNQRMFGETQIRKIVRSNEFQEWKSTITQAKPGEVLLIFPFSQVKKPKSLDIDSPEKFARWVVQNSHVPEFSTASFAAKTGFFASGGINSLEHGEDAALAFLNSRNPANFLKRIVSTNYARLKINFERAQELKVKIPFELFAYSYALSKSDNP